MGAVKQKGTRLDTIGKRLRAERERLGFNQVAWGEVVGVKKNAQINYEGDKRSPDGDYLSAAARAGADVLFILTGERTSASDETSLAQSVADALCSPADFAAVPVLEASLAAGGGSLNDAEAVIGHLAFRREWLKSLGISLPRAIIARARGDSMAPIIHDGDMVLIDRGRAALPAAMRAAADRRPAGIYAILDDGHARIKRLELAAPGTLAILSDNPEFPPEFKATEAVTIVGKVVWWAHTNRE